MAPRTRAQPEGSTASEICCRVGRASSCTATAYLELARLDGFAGVLGRGDLACGKANPESSDADDHRDARDPQQRIGVAIAERVELRRRHVLHRPGRAAQV